MIRIFRRLRTLLIFRGFRFARLSVRGFMAVMLFLIIGFIIIVFIIIIATVVFIGIGSGMSGPRTSRIDRCSNISTAISEVHTKPSLVVFS